MKPKRLVTSSFLPFDLYKTNFNPKGVFYQERLTYLGVLGESVVWDWRKVRPRGVLYPPS